MICLGIESTAHTFGVGIVDDRRVITNIKESYKPPLGSGIYPKKSAEHHVECAAGAIQKALDSAHLKLRDVDVIAVSQGPGMPPCLQVGLVAAKTLALKTKKPLIGVNHCIAHIEIGRMTTGAKDPIVVYVSGGNTQIIGYAAKRYRIFGETLDIAVGNALDSFARECGLPNPGGPEVMKLALRGKQYIRLPYVVKGMDLSYSGIVTEAVRKFKAGGSAGAKLEDLCYSFQETCFAMLVEVTERALAHTGKSEVLLVGGVAASQRFRKMIYIMCKERNAKAYVVPQEYAGDCGANIAWTGLLQFAHKYKPLGMSAKIRQNWRTDSVDVNWL